MKFFKRSKSIKPKENRSEVSSDGGDTDCGDLLENCGGCETIVAALASVCSLFVCCLCCGRAIIRCILIVFNVIFSMSGLAVLVVGALTMVHASTLANFMGNKLTALAIALIVTGVVIFIIASLGCCGAIKESTMKLGAYAVLLVIVFIVEFAVGIAAFYFKKNLDDWFKDTLEDSIKRYGSEDAKAWDKVQREYKCCGVESSDDWVNLSPDKTVPDSCCQPEFMNDKSDSCSGSGAGSDKFFQDGCGDALKNAVSKMATILIGVGIGIAFLQVIGIVLACLLATAIRQDYEYDYD